ncbi:hypothetical protein [Treponema endosymbiont of Eucomonympha sp.]|uniref:hypothetical protein n=1 Tax=Treponema endosymbiont of Eucomonympha sp. TaxID=1580831 RepID=UPI0007844ACF|nr:hypothetical protein [Treponema endosymbiont of Eucomonympha sp.]
MNKPTLQIKTVIERQAAAPDTQIDEAVYTLYGLTAKEVRTGEEVKVGEAIKAAEGNICGYTLIIVHTIVLLTTKRK